MKIANQKTNTILTKRFRYAKLKYKRFNPVQSSVFKYFDTQRNLVVAANTSTGKTDIATCVIARELSRGKKCVYISPTKALSDEKYEYWKKMFGQKYEVKIYTGDYDGKRTNVFDCDLVVMTAELFDSQSRRKKLKKTMWRIGCVVFDEVHLMRDENRGHRVEASIVRMCRIQPKARLVLLSATVSNGKKLAEWIETISKNKSVYFESDWRPVQLVRKFMTYGDMQDLKFQVRNLVENNGSEKIILFVHSKSFGYALCEYINQAGIRAEFHNASLRKLDRLKIEKLFADESSGFNVLVSTSTLAMGVNLPASLVVICGVTRAGQMIKPSEIEQEIGRCGRVFTSKLLKYVEENKGKKSEKELEEEYRRSVRGNVYIYVPMKGGNYISQLNDPENFKIVSGISEKEALCFHIVAEMLSGSIETRGDVAEWYERTFSNFDGVKCDFESVLSRLESIGAVTIEGSMLKLRNLGKIAGMYYYSPSDLYSLLVNFNKAFGSKYLDDSLLCWAMSNIGSNRGVLNKEEKEAALRYTNELSAHGMKFVKGSEKVGAMYYRQISGMNLGALYLVGASCLPDAGRFFNMLRRLMSDCTSWKKSKFIDKLEARVKYGVGWDESTFCLIDGIGKAMSRRLVELGYKTFDDVIEDEKNAFHNVSGLANVILKYRKNKR